MAETVTAAAHPSRMDRINRRSYATRTAQREFGSTSGWLDAGERAAVLSVAGAVRGGHILDIGVGAGRTTPLLREIGGEYLGIDYTPALLKIARSRFPSAEFEEADARNMRFAADSFDLAVFSYNGIDSVDLPGRLQILREVHRVLKPGGYFVFSSLNRYGPAAQDKWWKLDGGESRPGWQDWLRRQARRALRGLHYARSRGLRASGESTAVGNISALNFGLVTVFVTVREQVRQLEAAGFTVAGIYDDRYGTPIDPGVQQGCAPWYYFVARKARADGG